MRPSRRTTVLAAGLFALTTLAPSAAHAQEKSGPLPDGYESAPPPPVYKASPQSPSGYEVIPSPRAYETAPVPSMYRTAPSAPSAPGQEPGAQSGQESIPVAPSPFDAAPVAPSAQEQMPSPTAYETAPAAPPGIALPSAAPTTTLPVYVPPTVPQISSEELAPWKPADEGDLGTAPAEVQRSNSKVAFGDTVEERNRVFERVDWATEAYEDLINAPDRGVPELLLAEARCVAVIPHVVKAAVFIGLRYGKGILTCRDEYGEWSPIVFITLGGPSVGFQWGAQATDVVLFFRRERGVHRLLSTKVTLGGDASIAAGPVGRRASAEVDVTLTTDVLSYARNKGVFLGVSLEGSYLGIDAVSNEHFYGAPVDAERLLFAQDVEVPPDSAQRLLALLP